MVSNLEEMQVSSKKAAKLKSIIPKTPRTEISSGIIYSLLLAKSGVSFLCNQKAFEDLVALHQLQKPPPKGDLESTSLNTLAPSGDNSEQDLQANQKYIYRNRAGKWGNCPRVGIDNGAHFVLC